MRPRALGALLVTVMLLAPSVVGATSPVLPPTAAGQLRRVLDTRAPIEGPDGTSYFLLASLERDRVVVRVATERGGGDSGRFAITLLHPSQAPPGTEQRAGLAVSLEPGPVDPGLLSAIRSRLDAATARVTWVIPEVGNEAPPPGVERRSAAVAPFAGWDRALAEVDLYRGEDVPRARRALEALPAPDSALAAARIALRWRLLGEPARSSAVLAAVAEEDHDASSRLAARIAGTGSATPEEVVEAAGPSLDCDGSVHAAMWLAAGASLEAATVAGAVRRADGRCARAWIVELHALGALGRVSEAGRVAEAALAALPGHPDVVEAVGQHWYARGEFALASALFLDAHRLDVLPLRELMDLGARTLAMWLIDTVSGYVTQLRLSAGTALGRLGRVLVAAPTGAAGGRAELCPRVGVRPCLRRVEGGRYLRGAQSDDASAPGHDPAAIAAEGPPHEVEVPSFYMSPSEVDVTAYTACVRAGGCAVEDVEREGAAFNYGVPARAAHPLNGVSWRGADRFCRWIGGRLPTEAEWEFAARGTTGQRFSWGDAPPDCSPAARARGLHEGCPAQGTSAPGVSPVASPTGIFGLSGGVWEWTADWYAPYAAGEQALIAPTGPATGSERVQRGGAWSSEEVTELRAAYRASMPPQFKLEDVGFRCVVPIAP